MSTVNPDITKVFQTIVVGSGQGSLSFDNGLAHELLQITVEPPNATTTYSVYIKDILDDMEIFRREDDVVGTLNELLSTALPLCGANTLYIENASEDGAYKIRVVYR